MLADGAMGTILNSRGVSFERCFEELTLISPATVQQVHRDYLAAGAQLIETNTFGANRFHLEEFGLADRVRDLNLRAVKLAREAREIAGEPAFVLGAVGPIGRRLQPVGNCTLAQAEVAFREQIEALLEGGADAIIFETFSLLEELLVGIRACQLACDLPIVAQMTFDEDGLTLDGSDPETAARALAAAGASVIGVNCGVGPQVALDVVARMAAATDLPISAMPNAGLPVRVRGRFAYVSTPAYFADYAARLLAAGAKVIGGCCGTTPEHIAAMRPVVRGATPARPSAARVTPAQAPASEPADRSPEQGPTEIARKLRAGKFLVSVELDPPRGINPAKILAGAELLRDVGVDCFNVADSPMARVRMSCLAAARLIQERTGLEVMIHFTTRDRNLMALQSELIGAHATGIRNVLALTGDPPRLGDYPNATAVWDVDSIGLVAILKRLNTGKDWAGTSIGRASKFFVGCAVNPTAPDVDLELERFRRKLDAGADFVMSQPLYDMETLERFLDRAGPIPVPLILGIMPVQSYRHAEYLHNEVPGIVIPKSLLDRMATAGEGGMAEGLAQSQEFLAQAKRYVQGAYLMPSFGRYELVAELVKAI